MGHKPQTALHLGQLQETAGSRGATASLWMLGACLVQESFQVA
jgi:hypothetical protein